MLRMSYQDIIKSKVAFSLRHLKTTNLSPCGSIASFVTDLHHHLVEFH